LFRADARRLPVENSPWFQARSSKNATSPTEGNLLPANGAVIVLTIDALRADVIESGEHDATLPNLARLRDTSLHFTNARSTAPSTLTTVAALLTGKYYSQVYFTEISPGKVLPTLDKSARLPELLTQANVTSVHARALYGIGSESGVGRGFTREPKTPKDYGRASQLMDIVLAELDELQRKPQDRLFLYGHFVDSHAPYTLGGKKATPFESYLAEVKLVDREVGRLLAYLEERALKDRVLLVVGADHGEAFGEHGMRYHARSVYDELLRVPLMVHHPRVPVSRYDEKVTLIDLSATILDLFKLPTPGDFMGQSLVPLLLGQPAAFSRPIAADSGRRLQALLFDDGLKVIRDVRSGNVQVFDLTDDPQELHDLLDDEFRDVEPYIGATERFFTTHTLKVPGWKPPWRSF
jgi:arylsulfatase A-like enzyme